MASQAKELPTTEASVGAVDSFNTRTGDVVLEVGDIPSALDATTFSASSVNAVVAQAVGASADGENSIALNGQSTFHSTVDNVNGNVFGIYGQAQITVDEDIESLSVAIGNYAVVERTGASDKGSLDFLCGIQAQVHQYDTDAAAHTNAIAAFYANPFCTSGTVDEMYDILISSATLTGSTVTERYGIYIPADDIGTKKNWIAGNTQLGGDTFSAPTAAVDVSGTLKCSESFFLGTLAADPGSPVEGQLYFNNVTKKFRGYNGTGWDNLN